MRMRRMITALLVFAEAAVLVAALAFAFSPAAAQVKDDRYPFLERRQRSLPAPSFEPFGGMFSNPYRYDPFQRPFPRTGERAPAGDPSKAPAPRKAETVPTTTIGVLGDSIADWLAYGLEEALADNSELGVVRKIRPGVGLIRNDAKAEDWVAAARALSSGEKLDYLVVVMGLSDRQPIRDRAPARAATRPGQPGAAQPAPSAQSNTPQSTLPAPPADGPPDEAPTNAETPPAVAAPDGPATTVSYEFRSEKWVELYSKRVDEMIAALKSSRVPILWVGLPTVRGARSKGEIIFLNDLYRGRAEKAGITYVDVWDGFVDEDGNYAQYGPDYEGQTRRLRTADGVHFTKAGALKLAHYVRREIERLMLVRTTPMAIPGPEQMQGPAVPGEPAARPLAGPVVPLTGVGNAPGELVGAGFSRSEAVDPVAARVLVRGESLAAPAGRADDFAWPRADASADANDLLPFTPPAPTAIVRSPAQKTAPVAATPAQKRPAASAASAPARQQVR